jgi:hypothetical protein
MVVKIWIVVLLFMTLYSVVGGYKVLEQPTASIFWVDDLKVYYQVTINDQYFSISMFVYI